MKIKNLKSLNIRAIVENNDILIYPSATANITTEEKVVNLEIYNDNKLKKYWEGIIPNTNGDVLVLQNGIMFDSILLPEKDETPIREYFSEIKTKDNSIGLDCKWIYLLLLFVFILFFSF